jgi:short-subunit dehydrogenase
MTAGFGTAVITGASSGIGRALAVALAKAGVKVGVTARRETLLHDLAAEVRGLGGTLAAEPADVTDRDGLTTAVRKLEAAHGPTDLLIANAGIGCPSEVGPYHVTNVARMMAVNFLGVVHAFDSVMPGMTGRGRGHLVAISSLSAYKGMPGFTGYTSSKAAVNNYCEGLRIELRPLGVAVTTVCPGFVDTPMTKPNSFRMPFLLTADDAADRILRAIRRRRKVFDFPWPMRKLMLAAQWSPDWAVARMAAGKGKKDPI